MKYDYRKILVIWLAIGLSVSGWFFIYPFSVCHTTYEYHDLGLGRDAIMSEAHTNCDEQPYDKLALLITVVGSVLIGGLGYLSNRNKEKGS